MATPCSAAKRETIKRDDMIRRLNNGLRMIFLLLGAVFVLFKLIEKVEFAAEPEPEGFQTHEFDDIW